MRTDFAGKTSLLKMTLHFLYYNHVGDRRNPKVFVCYSPGKRYNLRLPKVPAKIRVEIKSRNTARRWFFH